MPLKAETRLSKKVKKALKRKFGGFWFKIHGNIFQLRGIPDLIGCVKGRFVAIELKIGKKKPKKIQYYMMKKIKENGGIVLWSNSCEDILNQLEQDLEVIRDEQ